jgi:phage repressor protein C with HTH and peptisase S24 domain
VPTMPRTAARNKRMLSHQQIWDAIDRLAALNGLSASGLAKAAGLDPTTFNRSKRMSAAAKPRWPTTESIAKVLAATETSFDDFVALVGGRQDFATPFAKGREIPLIGFAEAGTQGFFDDGGFPVGGGWEAVRFPGLEDENAYALEVSGDSMQPLYRDGDVIIVSPAAGIRRGDRVVLKTLDGEVMAKELSRRTARRVELASLNPDYPDRVIDIDDIAWMARIIWASQ